MNDITPSLQEYTRGAGLKTILFDYLDSQSIDPNRYIQIEAIDQRNRDIDAVVLSRPLKSGEGIDFIITTRDKTKRIKMKILREDQLGRPKIKIVDEKTGMSQIGEALFLYRTGQHDKDEQIHSRIFEWGNRGAGQGKLNPSKVITVGLHPDINTVSGVGLESRKIFPVIRLDDQNRLVVEVPHVAAATREQNPEAIVSFPWIYASRVPV